MALHQQSDGTNVLPPQAQLLPSLIDRLSEADPQRLYAEVPASPTTYAEGWREVTYRDLANAINGVAWLLDDKLGRGKNHNTIAYIGPNDLAYIVMILGASKAGYQVCVTSWMLRNTSSSLTVSTSRYSQFLHVTPSPTISAFSGPPVVTLSYVLR